MAETARNRNRIFTLTALWGSVQAVQKTAQPAGSAREISRFYRFLAAGMRVALRNEKLNSLADQDSGRTKMFSATFPSPAVVFLPGHRQSNFPNPKN
jgi:hypothetical protein